MSYLKVLTENKTWICPRSGNYRVTCVAGGSGGCTNTTTHNLGGTTSFGGYLSASGSWGDGVNGVGGIPQSGINGYTLMNYARYDDRTPVSSSMNKTGNEAIGYGGGGYGGAGGGAGKLNVEIMYIESGESVVCTIGKGGAANGDESSAGNPGVITIEYIDDDVVENTQQGDSKRFSIRIYSNGSLYTTLYCPEGESIRLSVNAPSIKGFAVENSGDMQYTINQSITPTQNMELYIVYAATYSAYIYHNGALYQTLSCTEGGSVILPNNITDIIGYSENNGSTTAQYQNGQQVSLTSNITLYTVLKPVYRITIYHNKSVYNSINCPQGNTVTLPRITNCTGYATNNTTTSTSYSNGGTITPTGDINLYSVVKQFTQETITSGTTSFLPCDQEISITFSRGSISTSGGTNYHDTITLNDVRRPPAVTLANSVSDTTFLSGSYSVGTPVKFSAREGDTVSLYTYFEDISDGVKTFTYDFPMSLTYSKLSGYVNSNS